MSEENQQQNEDNNSLEINISSDDIDQSLENLDISSEGAQDTEDNKPSEDLDYEVINEAEPEDADADHHDRPRNKLERLMRKKERELEKERMEKEMLRRQIMEQSEQGIMNQGNSDNFGISPPNRDNFLDEDQYIDARTHYAMQVQAMKYRKQQIEAEQAKRNQQTVKSYDDMMDKGASKYNDFETVTYDLFHGNFPSNPAMAEALFDSEYSDDISYVLGRNLEEARKIALLPPIKAVKKLAEIESKIKALKNSKKPASKPQIIEQLKSGKTSGSVVRKRLEDYSSSEIERMSVRDMDELEKASKRNY